MNNSRNPSKRIRARVSIAILITAALLMMLISGIQMKWIESTNDYTTQVLYRFGFQWPVTAKGYVHRFVDTIVGFDYFNV